MSSVPDFPGTPTTASRDSIAVMREELRLREKIAEIKKGLPHLYGWKWYRWARAFYESVNKVNLLCAANQISKSSTQIRKCIHWATEESLWPALWGRSPVQFWYLYPSQRQVNAEFMTKWVQFLPTGKYKTEAVIDGKPNPYAWKEMKAGKDYEGIYFFVTGVYVFFKTYSQDVQSLQTGTCDAVFCDEELPMELFDELIFRISASNGYFHMVFTATLGQNQWRLAMEPQPHEEEYLPEAAKWTVSMFDCMTYEDGTASHWTKEKIQTVINRCATQNEVLKRVHGRFIVDKEVLKYPQFDIKRHITEWHEVPPTWNVFSGVDIGSGGKKAHKSAIVFVAVNPEYTQGRVILGWRGDDGITTAGDVVEKAIYMRKTGLRNRPVAAQYYDWGNADFINIAEKYGENYQQADKGHVRGEDTLNTLFKCDALKIYDSEELYKLGTELSTIRKDVAKNKCHDDFADALRYAVTRIPWAWELIAPDMDSAVQGEKPLSAMEQELADRRKAFEDTDAEAQAVLDSEFEEYNEQYGT